MRPSSAFWPPGRVQVEHRHHVGRRPRAAGSPRNGPPPGRSAAWPSRGGARSPAPSHRATARLTARRPRPSPSRRPSGPPGARPPSAGHARDAVPSSCPGTAWSGPARRSPPARRREPPPVRRRPTATRAPPRAPRRPSPRAPARSRAPSACLRRPDQGGRVLGRRCLPGVGQCGPDHLGDALDADHAGPAGRADRGPGHDDHAHGTGAVHAVGRRRVQGESDVGVAGLLDQHEAAVGAAPRRPPPGPPRPVLGRDHGTRPAPCSATRLLAGVEHPHARAPAPTGSRGLTGATCPGWPLPQLNAPPSTQVDAPPTASIGAPEVGRRRLIRHVLQLPGQPPVARSCRTAGR